MPVDWNVVSKSGWDSEVVDASLMQNFVTLCRFFVIMVCVSRIPFFSLVSVTCSLYCCENNLMYPHVLFCCKFRWVLFNQLCPNVKYSWHMWLI